MTEYRRYRTSAAIWFFTVNLAERRKNRLLVDPIGILRAAFSKVKAAHPFRIDAIVVLPDHLHCIWTFPAGDADFPHLQGRFQALLEHRQLLLRRRADVFHPVPRLAGIPGQQPRQIFRGDQGRPVGQRPPQKIREGWALVRFAALAGCAASTYRSKATGWPFRSPIKRQSLRFITSTSL